MIGVVLWSSPPRQQAVIWCEDHAALAYLAGEEHWATCSEWPDSGDILELETEVVGDLRCARNVRRFTDERLPLLPDLLRRQQGAPIATGRHLMVVASGPGRAPAVEQSGRMPRTRGLDVAIG